MNTDTFLFYLNGLPYDGADRVLSLAKSEAKRYNKPATVRCTFIDDELVPHHQVEYATIMPDGFITIGHHFKCNS